MTQIFTGSGLGIHGSSIDRLYGHGVRGSAGLGQGKTSVSVNVANGNLVLKQAGGFLTDSGLLLSTQRLDAQHDYGTVYYTYDSAGRLIAKTG